MKNFIFLLAVVSSILVGCDVSSPSPGGCPVVCNDGTCSGCSYSHGGCCSGHGGVSAAPSASSLINGDAGIVNDGRVPLAYSSEVNQVREHYYAGRTRTVHGYYRRNGTYVRPYVRRSYNSRRLSY